MALYGGIDSGSSTTEMVILTDQGEIACYQRALTSGDVNAAGQKVLAGCLDQLGISRADLTVIVGTGYGRKQIGFVDRAVTEITCYAKGANYIDQSVKTVIDIGGQDSKVISVNEVGRVTNFAMNDKCAAGTGRFLEMLARTFNLELDQLGPLAARSTEVLEVSSICAVFAESEMISLFSRGAAKEDIIQAANRSVGDKIEQLIGSSGAKPAVMFCGGVARNQGVAAELERRVGVELIIPDNVDRVGALGAALLARE